MSQEITVGLNADDSLTADCPCHEARLYLPGVRGYQELFHLWAAGYIAAHGSHPAAPAPPQRRDVSVWFSSHADAVAGNVFIADLVISPAE